MTEHYVTCLWPSVTSLATLPLAAVVRHAVAIIANGYKLFHLQAWLLTPAKTMYFCHCTVYNLLLSMIQSQVF